MYYYMVVVVVVFVRRERLLEIKYKLNIVSGHILISWEEKFLTVEPLPIGPIKQTADIN